MRGLGEIIEPSTLPRLEAVGVKTVKSLLQECNSAESQRAFAQRIGLSSRRISQWVHRADLARITGIGGDYVMLLEAANINSTADLAQRQPEDVQELLYQVNKRRRIVKRVPALSNVQKWIHEAAALPPLHCTN